MARCSRGAASEQPEEFQVDLHNSERQSQENISGEDDATHAAKTRLDRSVIEA